MQTATSLSRAALNHRPARSLELTAAPPIETLEQIQRRVLWLATRIIHEANSVRPNHDGTKVGGHQASSASMVTIMTALYFHFLREGDRVSVKPHASPVLHAINYLLGQLPQSYLTTLRAFGGLQAYPSRTKDPDPIDFSTGSVGLGVVAPTYSALAQHYADAHFAGAAPRRFISLIGDAELDEGSIWETILDSALDGVENVLWIIDLNRQSLDRVVPGVRVAKLKQLFATANWQVLEAKYGRTSTVADGAAARPAAAPADRRDGQRGISDADPAARRAASPTAGAAPWRGKCRAGRAAGHDRRCRAARRAGKPWGARFRRAAQGVGAGRKRAKAPNRAVCLHH